MDATRIAWFVGLAIGITLCLWAQLFPRSNWRLFWGWQYRYRHVPTDEQPAYVRRLTAFPLVLLVLMAVILLVTG